MKVEVTTMLPVHSTAVKRRLLKLLSSPWLLVQGGMSSHPRYQEDLGKYVE